MNYQLTIKNELDRVNEAMQGNISLRGYAGLEAYRNELQAMALVNETK